MTEPTEAAKQRACDLANEVAGIGDWRASHCDPDSANTSMIAFARELQRISDIAEEVDARLAFPTVSGPNVIAARAKLATIILPKPVDPLEGFARWANISRDELESFLAKRGLEIREKQP